ncbi:MAG: TIGR02147 family protein [Proteobacteria bacterium]|nr:TIGR02147 family protein [Pseudomonadota bacterium]
MSLKEEKLQLTHAVAQSRIQRVLLQSLSDAKLKNPSYSLRAFSKKLKLSPAAVSEILNGKRSVSIKIAERILMNLDADPALRSEVLGAFRSGAKGPRSKAPGSVQSDSFTQVSLEQFRTIADWYHFAILSLFETTDCIPDADYVSQRLGVRKPDIVQALLRLERLEMIQKDKSGRFCLTGKQFQTADGVPSAAIRLSHFQSLDLAKKSLEVDGFEKRDFTSLTMAIDPSKMERARKMIRQFYTKLARELEVDPKGEVYMLNVGLFPLSRSLDLKGGFSNEES